MSARSKRSDVARVPLTRDRVLRTAIELADRDGFDSLTMRGLGQELGVQAMSLYNHVQNKGDIRDGIVDVVMNEVENAPDGLDWKAAIRQSAVSAHRVFMRHPWACNLMMQTTAVSPARLRWMEAVLRKLREAGFTADLADHAYHALDSHITGFTLWHANLPFETAEQMTTMAHDFLRDLPTDDYPYVVEHIHQHLSGRSADTQTEFEFGLDLILDGLERARDGHRGQGTRSVR